MKKVELFNVWFDALTTQETVQLVEKKIREKVGIHLLGVNADKINEVKYDPKLKKMVLQYLLLVIDFYLLLMTVFLFIIRIKKWTFPVRSSKPTTTKILEKERNALCQMILRKCC